MKNEDTNWKFFVGMIIGLIIMGGIFYFMLQIEIKPILTQRGYEKGRNFSYEQFYDLLSKEIPSIEDYKLKLTEACEEGCVMSRGLKINDSIMDYPIEVSEKVISCIFKCNDKYYYEIS